MSLGPFDDLSFLEHLLIFLLLGESLAVMFFVNLNP
jgi:hypothetical protein